MRDDRLPNLVWDAFSHAAPLCSDDEANHAGAPDKLVPRKRHRHLRRNPMRAVRAVPGLPEVPRLGAAGVGGRAAVQPAPDELELLPHPGVELGRALDVRIP